MEQLLLNSTKMIRATNTSTISPPTPIPAALTLFVISVCLIILFTGIAGNILVLLVFLSKWSCLKTYEVYIINLAAADLVATLVLPSKYLHQTIGGSFARLGVSGCIVMDFLGTCCVAVSSFTLVVISFDRYDTVHFKNTDYIIDSRIKVIDPLSYLRGLMNKVLDSFFPSYGLNYLSMSIDICLHRVLTYLDYRIRFNRLININFPHVTFQVHSRQMASSQTFKQIDVIFNSHIDMGVRNNIFWLFVLRPRKDGAHPGSSRDPSLQLRVCIINYCLY